MKGLLSDDNGKTFSEWINLLGGKSVNGNPVLFPYDDSVPYHIYWQVLNAKDYGVPQNRERVFIVGIRDDSDNSFRFPIEEILTKRLKDVLEEEVDEKYFLSEKMVKVLKHHNNSIIENDNPEKSTTIHACYFKNGGRYQQYLKVTNFEGNEISNTIRNGGKGTMSHKHNWDTIKIEKVGFINQDSQASAVYSENGLSQTMSAGTHGYAMGYIKVKSATSKGYEEASEGDSINFSVPNSETRRGRVGKGVIQINSSKESGGQQPYQQNRVVERPHHG